MPKKKLIGKCKVADCERQIDVWDMCQKHYARQWKYGTTDKIYRGDKRSHPLYVTWFERKVRGGLCDEWMDFWKFVEGVGQRPSERHYLVRLVDGAKYGPDNFRWKLFLKRLPDETRAEWNARQWKANKFSSPQVERTRWLKRRFGISEEQYSEMAHRQGEVCAICNKPEKSPKRGSEDIRRLSVDHCHATGKVRDLLCFRCNSTIGKVEEDIELLDAMKAYIVKHK